MPKIKYLITLFMFLSILSLKNVYAEEINVNKELNIDENTNIDINDILLTATDSVFNNYTINISDDTVVKVEGSLILPKKTGKTIVRLIHNSNNIIYNINISVYKIIFLNGSTSFETYNSNRINLKNQFNDLKNYNEEIIWNVEFQNIIRVQDNEIIPLSIGETDIYTEINNIKYVYHVKVLDDIKNPETASAFSYVFGIILLLMGIIVILYANKYQRLSE